MGIIITRKTTRLSPDFKRVIARSFIPKDKQRTKGIISKILQLSEEQTRTQLYYILKNFSRRHRNITKIIQKHFHILPWKEMDLNPQSLSNEQVLLIGAYFTMEFSIESAAFFNPSIVEDPDQSHLDPGQKRIIVSFRATGEGHVSSIEFRSGIIDRNNDITFTPTTSLVDVPEHITRHLYNKKTFIQKLEDLKIKKDIYHMVMTKLGSQFTYGELQGSIAKCIKSIGMTSVQKKLIGAITWLAEAHYEVTFSMDTALSERVIFPTAFRESRGIEDARFVRFVDDHGEVTYYATYTAFDGFAILSKFLETKDFYHFKITPINGKCAQDKGMALFPKKINGKYAMLSRIDGQNSYIMFSDNRLLWQSRHKLQEPKFPWEFIQIGNAGSPLETDKGWLVITHGVGPMRTYCLGAILLDLENPTKIIGQLEKPLMMPNEEEREGYVPNVLYSCGALIHNDELIIPYAMSDYASSFATTPLPALLDVLLKNK